MPQKVKSFEAVRAVDLFATHFPDDISYIEPGLLVKGGTLLLGGQAKIGKSLVMMEICRSVTTGKPLFDNPQFIVPKLARCLYIEAENGPRSIKKRGLSMFAGEDPNIYQDRFYVCSVKNPPQLKNLNKFERLVETARPNVIVMDPISFFYDGEENSNPEVNKVFYALNYLKDMYPDDECSIVIAHHFGKPPNNKLAKEGYDYLSEYNFRGASKWKDGADSCITMNRFSELEKDWEAWRLHMRFLCRHDSSPPESLYRVNERGDLRVRFDKIVEKETRKIQPVKTMGTKKSQPKQGSLLEQAEKELNEGKTENILVLPGPATDAVSDSNVQLEGNISDELPPFDIVGDDLGTDELPDNQESGEKP